MSDLSPQTAPNVESDVSAAKAKQPDFPSFKEALSYWFKLGLISFGGPAGQISIMHRELVEKRRWISESHFLHALNFCMLLPGPEAQQLATYLGWRLHGVKGGLAAGLLFILPAVVILFLLSWLYVTGGNVPWINGIFYGLQCAVVAVVVSALVRIAKKALKTSAMWILAAASFVAIFGFGISFVWVILGAGLVGFLGNMIAPRFFPASHAGAKSLESDDTRDDDGYLHLPASPKPTWSRALLVLVICGALWWVPIILTGLSLGWDSTAYKEGVFFSKAAMVTFGGAYAVLPYVAQQAVEHFGWITHSQMMAGLALAETTPGPLIIVLQFVGFVGGWQNPGDLSPLHAATIGALITTWATFVPCFLMVFLGAPHVEDLRSRPRIGAALSAVTAAVVGVILNLTIWFAWHTLWPLKWQAGTFLGGMDFFAALLGVGTYVALDYLKIGLIPVIFASAVLGLVWTLAF